MLLRVIKDLGRILLVWFLLSIVYFLGATLGNPEVNYENLFFNILVIFISVASSYLFFKYVEGCPSKPD